jgi:hypothetical protein
MNAHMISVLGWYSLAYLVAFIGFYPMAFVVRKKLTFKICKNLNFMGNYSLIDSSIKKAVYPFKSGFTACVFFVVTTLILVFSGHFLL